MIYSLWESNKIYFYFVKRVVGKTNPPVELERFVQYVYGLFRSFLVVNPDNSGIFDVIKCIDWSHFSYRYWLSYLIWEENDNSKIMMKQYCEDTCILECRNSNDLMIIMFGFDIWWKMVYTAYQKIS